MNFIKQSQFATYFKYLLAFQKSKPFREYPVSTIITLSTYFDRGFCAKSMSSDVFSDNNWRGVPLTELYGSQSPWGAPEFPLVIPGYKHAVLYHVPGSGLADDRPPKPQIGHDKWDQEHVKMPCSSHSLYPVEDSNGETHLKKRWEMIDSALWRPIRNSTELADTILSYNTKFKEIWKFRSLHKLFNEYLEEEESQYFFDVTLPEIAKLALALPKLVQSPIPLLKQHKNNSVSISQQQISSLLANAFFCTFPRRNTTKRTSEYGTYPFINFNRLYESSGTDNIMEKLKSICHYFRRVCTKAGVGVVTFSRRSVPPRGCPAWPASGLPLASLPLHVDPDNTIEDAHGLIQVDFANKFLGGGVLNHGCVQEEIRFVICPELLISMLFTEELRPNEALIIIGTERYSTYSGYGPTFQWTGDYKDTTPYDSSHRRRCVVLAIDALPYSSITHEYRREMIIRELNKAWIGFSFATDPQTPNLKYPGVATGNWGCGAFGGTPQLKSLLQMMACAEARRPMAYFTFKDNDIRDDVIAIYNLLVRYNVTVGQLYKYIVRFTQTDVRYTQLHAFLHQTLRDEDKSKLSQEKSKLSDDTSKSSHDKSKVSDDMSKVSDDKSKVSENKSKVSDDKSKVSENKSTVSDGDPKNPEKMDISTASETSLHDLSISSCLQKDQTKDSPDLFADSQEKMEESITEVKVEDTPNPATNKRKPEKSVTPKPSRLFEEMQKLDEKSSVTSKRKPEKTEAPVPSRLFEEMQKLDEQNPVTGKRKSGQSETPKPRLFEEMQTEEQTDPTTELKKRVSRKITDYFSKKPI